MSDLISRQAAIYAIEKRMDDITCEEFAEGMSEAITEISLLPSAHPEVTEEALKIIAIKRCLTILTNDYFHALLSEQPYTDEEIQTMQDLEQAQIERAYEIGLKENVWGEWIKIGADNRGYTDVYQCSNCKKYSVYPHVAKEMEYDYCPYCGAQMKGGEND